MTTGRRLLTLLVAAFAFTSTVAASTADAAPREFPPRLQPAVTWTGDGLFVFGGSNLEGSYSTGDTARTALRTDAAVLDPSRGTVRTVASSPLPRLYAPSAASTRRYAVVVGPTCAQYVVTDEDAGNVECPSGELVAARYDLDRRTWRRVTVPDAIRSAFDPSSPLGALYAVGTIGDTLIFGQRSAGPQRVVAAFWGYDPADDSWQTLGQPSTAAMSACVTPTEIVALTTVPDPGGDVQTVSRRSPDPGAQWTDASPSPQPAANGFPFLACADDAAMIQTGNFSAPYAVVDLASGTWTPIGWPPAGPTYWPGVGVGDAIAFPGRADGQALVVASGSWRAVPGFGNTRIHQLFWTGDAVVGYDTFSGTAVRVPVAVR